MSVLLLMPLHEEEDTLLLGRALAQVMTPGLTLYLHGELGAGKTTFTRAMLHALGHKGTVKSPTYTLAEPYIIHTVNGMLHVVHFDLYRMGSPEEFLDAGFREYFNSHTLCIIEWPEKAGSILPEPDLRVAFSITHQGRDVELRALSDKGIACLNRLAPPCHLKSQKGAAPS